MSKGGGVPVCLVRYTAKGTGGIRVLGNQRWSRRMTEAKAALDAWPKEVCPSTELRNWYDHEPAKVAEFSGGYKGNIQAGARVQALEHPHEPAPSGRLTLLAVGKADDISVATVFVGLLHQQRPGDTHAGITFWKEANHDYEGKHT